MDKNMTVFQDNNLLIFHILPDWDNHVSDLQGIVENLVRVTRLDYPSLDYTVLPSDGSMSYLIIHKHGKWNAYSYGEINNKPMKRKMEVEPTSVEPTSDKWTINRRKNQKRAFKFLTHLMILESSIMVENNGDTWFYLIGLLMQDCAELDNAKLYGKIEKYVNDERAGKHNV